MAIGFISVHPVFGIGVPPASPVAGNSGPLPFVIGVPSGIIPSSTGRGYGPLPFIIGMPETVVPPVPTPSGGGGGGAVGGAYARPLYVAPRRSQAAQDDKDLMELMIMISRLLN